MLLVVGGQLDPNILIILEQLKKLNIPHIPLLVGSNNHPRITWNLDDDSLMLNGQLISPTGCFIRYDVFSSLSENRSEPLNRSLHWYTCLTGWMLAHQNVKIFNRESLTRQANKPFVLRLAQNLGLSIPTTYISNDMGLLVDINKTNPLIAKPITDGGYCEKLDDVIPRCNTKNNVAAGPAIVQACLEPPEVRVYYVGGKLFTFSIASKQLDYRVDNNVKISVYNELPDKIDTGLKKLAKYLEMSFGAADFKMCPSTKELQFLEFNSAPMFAAFDPVVEGQLVDTMIEYLNQPKVVAKSA